MRVDPLGQELDPELPTAYADDPELPEELRDPFWYMTPPVLLLNRDQLLDGHQ